MSFGLFSARVGGDGLIDEGLQRLRLILLGDGTHDRLTHVTVKANGV